jgi:hypothetical protein
MPSKTKRRTVFIAGAPDGSGCGHTHATPGAADRCGQNRRRGVPPHPVVMVTMEGENVSCEVLSGPTPRGTYKRTGRTTWYG